MDIKEDGRRLSREAQHERRKQAIRLHRKGMKAVDIAAALSMSPVTVYTAIKVVETGGLRALVPKPTGQVASLRHASKAPTASLTAPDASRRLGAEYATPARA